MTELPRVSQETVVREPFSAANIAEDLFDMLHDLSAMLKVTASLAKPECWHLRPRRTSRFGPSFLVSESMTRNIRTMRNA